MDVSRRADVSRYFYFFLTPNIREDIVFTKLQKSREIFFFGETGKFAGISLRVLTMRGRRVHPQRGMRLVCVLAQGILDTFIMDGDLGDESEKLF